MKTKSDRKKETAVSTRELEKLFGPAPSAEDLCIRHEGVKNLEKVLETLTPREEKILRERYGLPAKEYSPDEVAERFTAARERVRQIEAKALRKLRHPSRASRLL